MKSVIITGITGQIGSYLAEFYLQKGFKVYGLRRRSSSNSLGCSTYLQKDKRFEVVDGDLTDLSSLIRLCKTAKADYFFNCAAQSHVGISFNEPIHTVNATGIGVLNCLEAIRLSGFHTRFLQFSTSEMFGGVPGTEPQNENTELMPKSPYGVAKLFGHHMTRVYRESYKMFACCAICYNNESPRRGPNFVTRKITLGVADILNKSSTELRLGNLEARRDWSFTGDIIDGVDLIIQHSEPDDFVLSSGKTHSIKDFCKIAFEYAGLGDYKKYVKVDPIYFRPNEVDILLGDSTKAKEILGWEPKVEFEELVKMMVDHDIRKLNG